jgi:hypothetical protein
MSAPLQSKNDIERIEPFRRNIGPPVVRLALGGLPFKKALINTNLI